MVMPQGLQCFDANGNIILDTSDRLTRVLGSVETGTSNGSITDDALTTGTPWYMMRLAQSTGAWSTCYVTFSGNTMSWTFYRSPLNNVITYGVY